MGRGVILLALVSAPAAAQTSSATSSVIRVLGHGTARVPPDVATVRYTLRGEGGTSDEAARALVSLKAATEAVLAGRADVRTGKLSIAEARDKACDGEGDDSYDLKTRLSAGPCAVIGYVATLGVTARITPVADAGTLLGLIGRAGGVDPRIEDYQLKDRGPARRAATSEAIADAREQAQTIAASSSARLGALRRVEDPRAVREAGEDVVVTGSRIRPTAIAPPPIAIALKPEPIEVEASLFVEFEIAAAP